MSELLVIAIIALPILALVSDIIWHQKQHERHLSTMAMLVDCLSMVRERNNRIRNSEGCGIDCDNIGEKS